MAYIDTSKLDEEKENQTQSGQSVGPAIGGSSNVVQGQSGGGGGVGAGGQGSWTNIQAYLGANKSDPSAAGAVSEKVGSEFSKERSALDQNAQNTISQSRAQGQGIALDDAKDTFGKAYQQYNFSGPQSEFYNNQQSRVKSFLGGQYQGPKSFDYQIGNQAARYADTMKDDNAFNQFMGDMYADKAKAPLTQGQRQLQTQLNVTNEALGQARKKALDDFSNLQKERDSRVSEVTNELSSNEQNFRTRQNALRDYLMGEGNDADTKSTQAVNDAKTAYERAYNNDSIYTTPDRAMLNGLVARGRGLTPAELAAGASGYAPGYSGNSASDVQWRKDQYAPTLNSWLAGQDAKHANVGMSDRQRFNAARDFLGMDGDRKKRESGYRGT
jgi:hypothetical protein